MIAKRGSSLNYVARPCSRELFYLHRSRLPASTFGTELGDDGRPIGAGDGDDLIVVGAERGRCFGPLRPPVDRDRPSVAAFRPRRRPTRGIGGVGDVVGRAHLPPRTGPGDGIVRTGSMAGEVTADRAG